MQRYVCLDLDICFPSLQYIQKQEFKCKHTFELLVQTPKFYDKSKQDTIFVQANKDDVDRKYLTDIAKETKLVY
jgi:hypothetical protein